MNLNKVVILTQTTLDHWFYWWFLTVLEDFDKLCHPSEKCVRSENAYISLEDNYIHYLICCYCDTAYCMLLVKLPFQVFSQNTIYCQSCFQRWSPKAAREQAFVCIFLTNTQRWYCMCLYNAPQPSVFLHSMSGLMYCIFCRRAWIIFAH